jgi:uncharacterized protein YggE
MSKSGIAAFALALSLAASAQGQFFGPSGSMQNIEGFTVAGKAAVMARPNAVEIDLSVSAGSELTADAIVKYRDARRKLRDAFTALKLGNVAVEERGLRVNQKGMQYSPYFFDYQPNQRSKTEVQLSRNLVVRGSDLRKMDEDAVLQLVAKLLDVAQDAGGHVGPSQEESNYYSWRWGLQNSSLVRFVVDDFEKLQEEAYEKAIADARARAERLARLSKVELGPIVAIREVVVPGEAAPNQDASPYYYGPPQHTDDDRPRKRLETPKFQEIPVRVELLVRFDILSKAEGKGRTAER